jgi:hypothetical protein
VTALGNHLVHHASVALRRKLRRAFPGQYITVFATGSSKWNDFAEPSIKIIIGAEATALPKDVRAVVDQCAEAEGYPVKIDRTE